MNRPVLIKLLIRAVPCFNEYSTKMAPIVTLSCKESFTITHNLNSPHLSNVSNKKVYGVCNNPVEHSHEYSAEVITRGLVDSSIGTVMSLSDLKSHVRKVVVQKLNGRNLNNDIDFFKTIPTTMENLAIYIWQSMKRELEAPELLFEVKLMDKEENCVVYNGTGGYSGKRGQSILTSDTD